MAASTLDIGSKMMPMVGVASYIRMEMFTKETGSITKPVASAHLNNLKVPFTEVSLKSTSSTVKVPKYSKMEASFKDNSNTGRKMGPESFTGQMAPLTLENFTIMKFMAMAPIPGQMAALTSASGKKTR